MFAAAVLFLLGVIADIVMLLKVSFLLSLLLCINTVASFRHLPVQPSTQTTLTLPRHSICSNTVLQYTWIFGGCLQMYYITHSLPPDTQNLSHGWSKL